MGEYFFGLVRKGSPKHNGRVRSVSARLDKIAQTYDADFVCASPPGSDLLGWFSCQNRGAPFDGATQNMVCKVIKLAGLGWIWEPQ